MINEALSVMETQRLIQRLNDADRLLSRAAAELRRLNEGGACTKWILDNIEEYQAAE